MRDTYTRREALLSLGTAAAVGGFLASPLRNALVEALSKPDIKRGYLLGVDFRAYDPSVVVEGKPIDTAVGWTSNNSATDIGAWSDRLFLNALSFTPYTGALGIKSGNEGKNMKGLLGTGHSYVQQLGNALRGEIIKEMVVRVPLGLGEYRNKEFEIANREEEGFPEKIFAYAVKAAIGAYESAPAAKKNVSLEISGSGKMPFTEMEKKVRAALELKEKQGADMPLFMSLDDSILAERGKGIRDIFPAVSGIVMTISPSFRGKDNFPGLEENLKRMRDAAKDKKAIVRIRIAEYTPHEKPFYSKFDYVSTEEFERAMTLARTYADGSFIDDVTGLLLFRGSQRYNGDVKPVDGGEIRGSLVKMHKKILGVVEAD